VCPDFPEGVHVSKDNCNEKCVYNNEKSKFDFRFDCECTITVSCPGLPDTTTAVRCTQDFVWNTSIPECSSTATTTSVVAVAFNAGVPTTIATPQSTGMLIFYFLQKKKELFSFFLYG
jgi:hypothetical protein